MRRLALVLTAIVLSGPVAANTDDKKDDAREKLIGVWEKTKGEAPMGTTVEFTPDGKIKIVAEIDGKRRSIVGAYVLEGEVIKLTLKGVDGKDRKDTMTIKSLTDKELIWEDDKGKNEFKKQEKK